MTASAVLFLIFAGCVRDELRGRPSAEEALTSCFGPPSSPETQTGCLLRSAGRLVEAAEGRAEALYFLPFRVVHLAAFGRDGPCDSACRRKFADSPPRPRKGTRDHSPLKSPLPSQSLLRNWSAGAT